MADPSSRGTHPEGHRLQGSTEGTAEQGAQGKGFLSAVPAVPLQLPWAAEQLALPYDLLSTSTGLQPEPGAGRSPARRLRGSLPRPSQLKPWEAAVRSAYKGPIMGGRSQEARYLQLEPQRPASLHPSGKAEPLQPLSGHRARGKSGGGVPQHGGEAAPGVPRGSRHLPRDPPGAARLLRPGHGSGSEPAPGPLPGGRQPLPVPVAVSPPSPEPVSATGAGG